MDTPDWKNLRTHLKRARGSRTQPAIAAASGVSLATIQKYEAARATTGGHMLVQLVEFYGWPDDALDRVLAGGKPMPDPLVGLDEPLTEDEKAALDAFRDGHVGDAHRAVLRRAWVKLGRIANR